MTTSLMRAGRMALAAVATAVLWCGAQAAPAEDAQIRVPTIDTLAQFPKNSGFRLSPDGRHMLAIHSEGDVRAVLVWDTENMSAQPKVINVDKVQIDGASFLKNDLLAIGMSVPIEYRGGQVVKTFKSKTLFTDMEGKEWMDPARAMGLDERASTSVAARLVNDPDNVLLEGGDPRAVYRYNVHTKSAKRIMRLGETDYSIVFKAGEPWAKHRVDADDKGTYVAVDIRGEDGEWHEHFRSYGKTREAVDVVAVGSKPGTAVISSNVGHEFAGLYEYDIATRKTTATLFEHKYFDATGVTSLRADGSPEKDGYPGFRFDGVMGDDELWADPKIDAVLHGVAQALGIKEIDQELVNVTSGAKARVRSYDGVSVQLQGYHGGDVATYLIHVGGLSYPPEDYLMRGDKLQLLAKEYPAIDNRALGSAKFVYYTARDGLNIPAYLVMPNPTLCGPGPYSAVIHPHGGPWARDGMEYDWSQWIPLMVSQCRVVLRPQYRGSSGWGRALWVAGDEQWGLKMQDDKDDAVKWLVAQKLADPKRVAMFGFSYGGYAAFAASVRPNGLYKCAIAGAGVSDLARIGSALFSNPFYQDIQEPTMRGLSPLSLADKIQIPIMVYHGDRDTTVPLEQSIMFADKAKSAGKPVEFHELADFSHGRAWKRATEAEELQLISDYFTKGCGGGGL